MGGYKKRRQNIRVPRKVYVIVCEGKVTERIYFKKYKTRYSNLTIETPDSKSTDPKNLVKFAIEQIKDKKLDLKNGDAIWCVFDCDENTNEDISRAYQIAKNDVKVCLSNPNFEFWFLLHYDFIIARLERSEVIHKLKKHISDYDKSKNVFDILLDKRSIAIANSKKLNEMHEKK